MNAADDSRALADILEAVDDAGGDVRDVDIDLGTSPTLQSPGTVGPLLTLGQSSETVFTLKVAVDGSSQEAGDEDVAESIPIGERADTDDLECTCGPDGACSICGGGD